MADEKSVPQFQVKSSQHPGLNLIPDAVAIDSKGRAVPINKVGKGNEVKRFDIRDAVAAQQPRIFVPMIFRLLVPNELAPPSPLILYVTPSEIQIARNKALTEHVTRTGTSREEWGDELDVWTCSGQVAAFYSQEVGLTQVRRSETAAYKNFVGLLSFYRNNGRTYYSRGRSADPFTAKKLESVYDLERQQFRSFKNREDLSARSPNISTLLKRRDQEKRRNALDDRRNKVNLSAPSSTIKHVGSVEIFYDMRILEGHFDSFEWSDNVSHPFNIDYSFTFTVKRQFDIAAWLSGFGTTVA